MRTIIHIGQHKTGTTSIQHYLQSHRDTLAQQGLYVPNVLMGFGNPSHFMLNVYALDEHRESTAKIRLKETVSNNFFEDLEARMHKDIQQHYLNAAKENCQEIIWSNEGLYLLNSEHEYQRLRDLFGSLAGETLCICCFRDKESYARSYKAQLESLDLPLSEDPDSYRYFGEDSWLFDYEGKVKLLEKVFDEVLVLDYDSQDMVKTFMTSINYTPEDDTSRMRLNPTDKPPTKSG